jgi:RNA 2',3'-cyclic 3'-phosphodiesterase
MRTTHPPKQPSFGPAFDIGPRRRLFFCVCPDIAATGSFTRLIEQLRQDRIMPGRPVDPDRLHATLHHLGDFADQVPPSLVPAADAAAATVKGQPFDISFDYVGGTRGQLLLRASDGSAPLRAFRQNLSTALIKAGLRRYVDPAFSPHVTLSYDFCDVPEQPVNPIRWTVQQFVLIESLLGHHQHIVRGRWSIRP